MPINQLIFHSLEVDQNGHATVQFRPNPLIVSPEAEMLVDRIREVYSTKTGKVYGAFRNEPDPGTFKEILRRYFQRKINFYDFSCHLMEMLRKNVDGRNLATGGYIMFCDYIHDAHHFFMIVMLKDQVGAYIDPNTLDVRASQHIDLSKLHVASRIDLDSWNGNVPERYISFVKGRTGEIARYFIEFLGCEEQTNSKRDTRMLIDAVRTYAREKSWDTEMKKLVLDNLFDYCDQKRKDKEPAGLEMIAHIVDENAPDEFLEYANRDQFRIADEIEIDSNTLKTLRRVIYKGKGYVFSVEKVMVGQSVKVDAKHHTVIFQDIPDHVIDEMREG
jgi:nucleoid-associated protein